MSVLAAPVLGLLIAALPSQSATPSAETVAEYVQFESVGYRDRVEANGATTRMWQMGVLLRNATAVTEFGQIAAPYVDGYGEATFEEVLLEKADGRKVEVKNGLLEDINPFGVTNTGISSDVRFKKLTIPGIEAGDRLSYRIVVRQKPLAPGRAFGQMKLPLLLGEPLQTYELDVPRDASIRVRLREGLGATWEEVPGPADRLIRRLSARVKRPDPNLKKFTKRMVQEWADPDVLFSGFDDWNQVAQWWWTLSKERAKPDAAVETQARALAAPGSSSRERLVAIHEFVASKIRYLNVGFGIGRMQPHAAPQVLASRYGDCKDDYTLLAALASVAGVDVRPVLLSRSGPDLHDDVPAPQQFDHVIGVAQLGPDPASWLWLDPTTRYGAAGYLASDLRNRRGLLIEPSGEGRMVRTPEEPPFLPRVDVEIKGELQPDGGLRARNVWTLRSDGEVAVRAALEATPEGRRAEALKALLASAWRDPVLTNVVLSDPAATAQPFRVEFQAEQPAPAADKGGWSVRVPLPDFGLAEADQDAGADPVEFDAREFGARAEITIPEGLQARPPLSVTLERPFGRFESVYAVEGRTLKVTRTLKVARRTLARDETPSYEALRKAIDTDRDQKFLIIGERVTKEGTSADSLHTEGVAAFDRKDYAKAVELLLKATEADAKVKDGLFDLGRALSRSGRDEEAVQSFSRQVELTPFHESAYAWRASVLERLNRPAEAEEDLLKQIEVAPFEVWSYETLASRRLRQKRFHESAELYARAAAIQPNKPGRWIDAGYAYARDGRPAEARAALERARTLDPPDWMKISAAGAYDVMGEPASGLPLASEGLTSVGERMAALTPASFGEDDIWGAEYLARGWYVIGSAALAAGDTAKAQRYLDAAWRIWFLPEAGWALGTLREKQGRMADAVDLWSMADTVPNADWKLPADRQQRIDGAVRKLPQPQSVVTVHARVPPPTGLSEVEKALLSRSPEQLSAGSHLSTLRTVKIAGDAVGDVTEEVLLLTAPDGRIESIRGASPKDPALLKKQIDSLGVGRVAFTRPDEQPFKAVRRALLVCSRATSCALVLDLPGLPGLRK
jgi:hypothetical protein